MNEQVPESQSNRREMLKLSATGVLGAVAAGAMMPQATQAATTGTLSDVSHAMWTHGNSMQVEYPERLVQRKCIGWYIRVEGWPGTVNWFHFAIPTPVLIDDVRQRAACAILTFETASVDAFVRDVHIYDGSGKIAEHNGVNLSGLNSFTRFDIATKPEIWQGIGISIGVEFGLQALDHWMTFVSAGCDFTRKIPK
jgi:hypothetical protein